MTETPGYGLRVTTETQILRIVLARPERRNAFDGETIANLAHLFRDPGPVRAILLTGEGAHFSAGAALEWLNAATSEDARQEQSRLLASMLDALERCELPVIVHVRGFCLGAACGLVAAADISIGQSDAIFGLPEVKYGLVPAVIAPFLLRRLNSGHARRYLVTGERFTADRAAEIGLISEVSDDPQILEDLLREVRTAAPTASKVAKLLAHNAIAEDQQPQLMAKIRATREATEGLAAAAAKRVPYWIDHSPEGTDTKNNAAGSSADAATQSS